MTKANEVSQIDLLERDVLVLFEEARRLRSENEALRKQLKMKGEQAIKNTEKAEKIELGFYIKCQRQAREMTRREFANLVRVSTPTISNYERGQGNLYKMNEVVERIRGLKRV